MCSRCSFGPLTIDQGYALAAIRSAWNGVTAYGDGRYPVGSVAGTVLVVAHKGSEYHFSLVRPDGERQIVSDDLNKSHWLEAILNGDLSLLWSETKP